VEQERDLVEATKHLRGRFGGFTFAGQTPDGVRLHEPLPRGTVFPNGATAAVLLTFDVEGTYGNAVGDMEAELTNYAPICRTLERNGVPATFNVVGRMAEEHGGRFLEAMLEAGCEVASHGYVHDLDKQYGGTLAYAGHYGPEENRNQVLEGVRALEKAIGTSTRCSVGGIRLPYGHFNEYTYDAIAEAGLVWSSNVGIDDFVVPGQGFGPQPFRFGLGEKTYPVVEIPLDSQTFDWPIWIAGEQTHSVFVGAVRAYCASRGLPFNRTPRLGFEIWKRRIGEAVREAAVFTLLCHPIYLTVRREPWGDPLEEFLYPTIDYLGEMARSKCVWLGTCTQMARFYEQVVVPGTPGE
jgi:peptidoglycan/xylan/chitin deacetylase (PgdA/CDA1 family)